VSCNYNCVRVCSAEYNIAMHETPAWRHFKHLKMLRSSANSHMLEAVLA